MLVRLVACGVCHTDLYTASGADPSGYTPCVLGHEGAGVERVGDSVTRRTGRSRDHAVRPGVRQVHPLSQPAHESLRCNPRPAGPRLPAGRYRALLEARRAASPLHGHIDLLRVHGDARDRAREGQPRAPLEGCAPFACGLSTGIGAALYTARVEPGSTCVVFGCGLVGLGAVVGCRLAGAERIVAIDLSQERLAEARRHGATDTRPAADDTVDWIRSRPAASAPTTPSRRPAT